MKIQLALGATLIAFSTGTGAEASIAGTYRHTYRVPSHPIHSNSKFYRTIQIHGLTKDSAILTVEMLEATAGSSCAGHITGKARREGSAL